MVGLGVGVAALVTVIAFVVGGAPHTRWEEGGFGETDCGSVMFPNVVSKGSLGDCEHELVTPRLIVIGLTAGAVALAGVAAANSGRVGRTHTRLWDASLVVGVASAFLLLWALLAWLFAHGFAYDPG